MYTVLNNALQVKGKLSLNNGQGSTAFFSDVITQQMATDNSTDPDAMTSLAFNATDKVGNTKQWGHSLSINVEATDLGTSISTNDYLMYFDQVANHYYLMKVLTVGGDRTTGYLAIDGINTAIYELGKQFPVAKTYTQANLETVVKDVYKNSPFSIRIEDDLETVIDYTVAEKTSAQAILQDLQTKYDVDVDSWIELDNSGNISERVLYFGHLGSNNGELIRYGGAKGFENMSAQEVSDNIYTKLYVVGQTDDKDATKGHIASVNNGMDYIVDDEANASLYAIGASQNQPNYLEGTITNTLLSEPRALLTWAQAQMGIFNHPRFNYTVSPMHDQIVGVGDSITVQDFHMKPMILVNSKVIQKTTSFSSPETNTFVLGEFSNIFTENANKGAGVINLIKKDVTVVQEAADNARVAADEAHKQAVAAQQQAIKAQTSADGKSTNYYGSVEPSHPQEGDTWFWVNGDKSGIKQFVNGDWADLVDSDTQEKIAASVTEAVAQAKSHTATAIEQNNAYQQEVMNDIAKSQADLAIKDGDFNNKAQAMADKALSDAKANTVQVAQETLNSANDSIAQAKYAITDAYKNADGVISKKVDDTATSIGNTISQNKIDSDGKISTAQSTATQALNEVTTKVSQTVYDQKTGDLTQAISKAQQTADGVVSTVGNYKTSNDKRVGAAESTIEQNSKDITARVSKTDYDNNNSQLNTRFTKVEATADGASTTVSKLQTTVNNLGQVNQLFNTEFNPDLEGWSLSTSNGGNYPYKSAFDKNVQANMVGFNTTNAPASSLATLQQDVIIGNAVGGFVSLSWQAWAPTFANYANLWVRFYDNNNQQLDQQLKQWTPQKSDGSVVGGLWTRQKFEGIAIPSGSVKISVFFQAREGINAYLVRPMLVFNTTIGDYVPGNYNNNAALAQVKITADGVSSIVSNPTTGLSTRVQTAEGTLNTVKSTADGAMSKASQTSNQIAQEITDRTTGDSNTLQSAKNFTQSTITSYDSGLQSQLTQTNDAFLATVSANNLIVDSSLTDSTATNTIVNWIPSGTSKWYYSPGVSYQGVQSMGYNQTANDASYSFVDSQPWSNNSFSGTTLNVSIDIRASTIGGSSTDYLIVYLMELDVNSKLITQTSITNTISTSNNSWVNYRKKITVDSASKSFYLRYQMRGNGNVYIARPYVGVQELIAGGYTAGSNNNNQTILSLFKDNWSIGITDNIGAITSGIVGNASQMSLISKKVIIDSPSTQITGTAWIKSAMIANGTIGTAQIGDAVITSAKIANLDVSKLTGDTITGFNFNVNRSMNIASGGVIKSDVINMDKTSFILNTSTVATDTVTTAANNKMILSNVTYSIDSTKGAIISSGKVNLSHTNGSTSNANFDFRIAPDYFSMSSKNWSDGSNDNYMTMTDYSVSFLAGSPLIDKASSYSYVGQDGIATTGTVLADAISGHGSKPMYINAGGTLRLAANDGSGVKVYISNTNVQTNSPIISGNITLNTGHAIVSNDNGKMFFYGSNGNQIDLGVKSLSQSSLVSLKENISKVIPKQLLSETLRADLRSYNFTGDDITDKHVTPMIDDVNHEMYIPNDWLSPEGTGVDTYSVIGYLIGSVKALQEQITELKANQ